MTAQQILEKKYGVPDSEYLGKYCSLWYIKKEFPWFPATDFLVNHDLRGLLTSAFTSLQSRGLHTEIGTFDGCYNDRDVRGFPGTASIHSWAAAIDLNEKLNPMHINPPQSLRLGKWSPEFVKIMIDAGIYFGGYFKHRSDPMHFALVDG